VWPLVAQHLVFSYIDQRVFAADAEATLEDARAALASAGEPWLSGFQPDRLETDLRGTGLRLLENLGPKDLHGRYRADGLKPSPAAHVARAQVARRGV
jgi:hypothetical protein